jgi:hypothetical protein
MSKVACRFRGVLAAVLICSVLVTPTVFAARTGESPFRRFVRKLIPRVFDDLLSIPPGALLPLL